MIDKIICICSFVLDSVTDWCESQEMCDNAVSEDHFKLKYCPDRYKSQKICDKDADGFSASITICPRLNCYKKID